MGIEQRFVDSYQAVPLPFDPAQRRSVPAPDLALKRLLDLAISLTLLLLLSPVLLLIAVLVRMDFKGPALFRQKRLGLGGKPFDIVKFRTMSVQENGDRVVQAKKNDPRVTRIGRFLRTTSLDELPQLINVVKGEMSLVGPRPHAQAHDKYYTHLIDNYCERQAVKPGITGWAQVNGFRGETPTLQSMRDRVTLDLWYVQHFSIALDLRILALTLLEVLRPRNAH